MCSHRRPPAANRVDGGPQRIVAAATDWGIPVVRDVPLARALVELQPGEVIPEALYEAVAEVLRDLWEREKPSP